MKKIFIFILFLNFFNSNVYCNENKIKKNKLETINNNGIKKITFYNHEIMDFLEISEDFYNSLKKDLNDYKETKYYIYNSSLKNEKLKDVKVCNIINFDQANITGIYITAKNNAFGYISYKNNDTIIIRTFNSYCEDVNISNCNTNGNNGINCLKRLPDECEFVISSTKYIEYCINLKTDEYELVEFGCDKNGCNRLEFPVEFEDGY